MSLRINISGYNQGLRTKKKTLVSKLLVNGGILSNRFKDLK